MSDDDVRTQLLAVLREELAIAQAAWPWHGVACSSSERILIRDKERFPVWEVEAAHIVTQSPERTIRRVEALIAEIKRHEAVPEDQADDEPAWCLACGYEVYPCPVVRLGCAMYNISVEVTT